MKKLAFTTKNKCYLLLGICAFLLLLAFYIHALSRPGVWHGDTFLFLQDDASYAGNGEYFDYHMSVTEHSDGTEVIFSVDDMVHRYFVKTTSNGYSPDVIIYEDDVLIFNGYYQSGFLMDANGIDFQITVTTSNMFSIPEKEDYFPSKTQLYQWAVMEKPDMRGNFEFVFYLVCAIIYLILDFCFPDRFFRLQHFLTVEGGSPTEFYRIGQWIGRIAMIIMAVVCVFISLSRP